MIQLSNKENCSGCRACVASCPKQCISGEVDTEGFWYPKVDMANCVDCHICETVCPMNNVPYTAETENRSQYSVYCKDETVRSNSSSGGVFSLLAKYIIEHDGIVCGAAFDNDFAVKHVCVSTFEDVAKLRGSKYVQSDNEEAVVQVKRYLKEGKTVLFSGCPCQVNGLLNSVDKKVRENLFTIDFVCHGVPSPKIFSKYLQEKKGQENILGITFRDKRFGWKTYSMKVECTNNVTYQKIHTFDDYLQLYIRNLISRPSCYFCNQQHCSDITLADYWTIAKTHPEMNDDKGISKMIVNTEKGVSIWQEIQSQCVSLKEDSFDRISQCPRTIPTKRGLIYKEIDTRSFKELYSKYGKRSFIHEFKNTLKGYVKIGLHFLKSFL